MRTSKITESQIVAILKEADDGIPIKDVAAQPRDQRADVLQVESRYGYMDVAKLGWVRELEAENSKLKRLFAEQVL